ncbi:MAG: hypothetical protein RLY65_1577, partial [Pseudomonadota bacterium]
QAAKLEAEVAAMGAAMGTAQSDADQRDAGVLRLGQGRRRRATGARDARGHGLAGAAAAGASGANAGKKDEDVVDVDFKEVKRG